MSEKSEEEELCQARMLAIEKFEYFFFGFGKRMLLDNLRKTSFGGMTAEGPEMRRHW